jgi:hypothetical protein
LRDERYTRVIGELCEALGMHDATGLAESQHLQFGETTVALMHDPDSAPDTLFVYVDLGPLPEHERALVHEGMLRANVRPDAETLGHFGLHPSTGHATWVVRLRGLDKLRGADLASFVASQVAGLQGWMERVLAPLREGGE